jgi:hypothetical protein
MPATPLEVTAADVLAWDRQRGEPPLTGGFTPEQEQAILATRQRRIGVLTSRFCTCPSFLAGAGPNVRAQV